MANDFPLLSSFLGFFTDVIIILFIFPGEIILRCKDSVKWETLREMLLLLQ